MVVLCVADGNGVVRGQPKHVEGNMKAIALLTPCGNVMTRPALKTSTSGSSNVRNHVEQPWCLVRIGVHETLAGTKRNATASKSSTKAIGTGGAMIDAASIWKVNDGPILGDHSIDEMQITGDATEVVQDPASDEQHGNSYCVQPRSHHAPTDQARRCG